MLKKEKHQLSEAHGYGQTQCLAVVSEANVFFFFSLEVVQWNLC